MKKLVVFICSIIMVCFMSSCGGSAPKEQVSESQDTLQISEVNNETEAINTPVTVEATPTETKTVLPTETLPPETEKKNEAGNGVVFTAFEMLDAYNNNIELFNQMFLRKFVIVEGIVIDFSEYKHYFMLNLGDGDKYLKSDKSVQCGVDKNDEVIEYFSKLKAGDKVFIMGEVFDIWESTTPVLGSTEIAKTDEELAILVEKLTHSDQIQNAMDNTQYHVAELVLEWSIDNTIFLNGYEGKEAAIKGTYAYSDGQYMYLYPVADFEKYNKDEQFAKGLGRDSTKYVTVHLENLTSSVKQKLSSLKDGDEVTVKGAINNTDGNSNYFLVNDAKFVEK